MLPSYNPLMLLQEHSRYALLGRGIYHPRNVGWCSSGDSINGVRCQDSSISPPEGVGLRAVKIVTISVCQWGKALGVQAGLTWWVGAEGNKKYQSYSLP